ncbi:MAG: hypothetical protein LBH98_05595 [Chitinispirillales bacterium]|jgi:hypothetical protein|nr:hypothetical protein [Chitinispirillales bacterium]
MKKIIIIAISVILTNSFAEELFFIDGGDTIRLSPEKSVRGGENAGGWFLTQHGHKVKIDRGIIVELQNGLSAEFVFSKYDIKSFEKLSQDIFLVIPNDDNKQFELSRKILENNFVKNSHPNLIRERKLR